MKTLTKNYYKTHSVVVTLEDNTLIGGYGSAIAELMSDKGYTSHKLLRFGLPDDFVEHGNVNDLYKQLKIDGESVAQKLMEIL